MGLEELKTILGFGGIGVAALAIFVLYWSIRWQSEDKKELNSVVKNHLHEHAENHKDDIKSREHLATALTRLETKIK